MSDPTTDGRSRSVEIPERTADAIAGRLDDTEFETVDGYVTFALEQLLRELERASDGDRQTARETTSDGESATGSDGERTTDGGVEDRLESLGYL